MGKFMMAFGLTVIGGLVVVAMMNQPQLSKPNPVAQNQFPEIEQMLQQELIKTQNEYQQLNKKMKKSYQEKGWYWSPYRD